jgi:hypothetical protein
MLVSHKGQHALNLELRHPNQLQQRELAPRDFRLFSIGQVGSILYLKSKPLPTTCG